MEIKNGVPVNGNLWILTGTRGSGKTTLCQRLAAEAHSLGWDVAGVISPAVYEGGEKIGTEAVDLRSREGRLIAQRPPNSNGNSAARPTWVYDQTALVWVNQVLNGSVPCDMLVLDELGPLELEAGQGWNAGLKALDSRNYQVGLVTIRRELLAAARSRWPFAGVVDMDSPESFVDPLELRAGRKNADTD